MSDERTAPEKATITLVYHLVDELRKEVNTRFIGMDERFDNILSAIESLRCDFVNRGEWVMRNAAVDAAIESAVDASEDDRQKLWVAIHAVESQLKWAAGIVISAFVAIIIFMLQGHFTP